jgi:hypothetical protein
MKDLCPPTRQRPLLIEFQQSLDASRKVGGHPTLRRDNCGDWAIWGRLGHIYAVPIKAAAIGCGFQLVIGTNNSPRRWTGVKRRLAFCQLSQDGDDEGTMILNRLPTEPEAELIREALDIRKAPNLTEEHRSALAERGRKWGFQKPTDESQT